MLNSKILVSILLAFSCLSLTGCRARAPIDRSDAGITARVKAELASHSDLNVRYLDIYTHMRIVTLSGMVDSSEQKKKIAQLVRRVPGIRQVIINLVIND